MDKTDKLKDDILIAISWFIFLPENNTYYRDIEALERLKKYTQTKNPNPDNKNKEINNCEKCHNYNSLIHWGAGIFHQCMMGNNLWEKCDDFDEI